MQKICIICGKEFVPHEKLSGIQKCCSKECSKENGRRSCKKYMNMPENKKKYRELYQKRTKNNTLCRICGKPTVATNTTHKPFYHEECLVDEAIEIIKAGRKLTNLQYNRLYIKGYSMKELRNIMIERINEGEENENETGCAI